MRPLRKVVIILPVAKSSLDAEFVITFDQAYGYLIANMDKLPYDVQVLKWYERTFPIDANREICAQHMVEGFPIRYNKDNKPVDYFHADISLWIDTDHTLPRDAFINLLKHDRPIMLGIYYIKAGDKEKPFYPVIFKRRGDGGKLYKAVMEYPRDQLFEVDFAGMGAACIHREVFEKLDPPFFQYELHPNGSSDYRAEWKNSHGIKDVSEDRYFWDKVKDNTNYPILVDPKVQFGHRGMFTYDHWMYFAWLEAYKERMRKEHTEREFDAIWKKMAIAEPYKEIKVYGLNGKEAPKRRNKRGKSSKAAG